MVEQSDEPVLMAIVATARKICGDKVDRQMGAGSRNLLSC
jgi:hypothetical protein